MQSLLMGLNRSVGRVVVALACTIASASVLADASQNTLDPQAPVLVSRRWQDGLPAGVCQFPRFSDSKQYLSFSCLSSDVVPGDNNDTYDLFLLDRETNAIERMSLTGSGKELRYPSPNGAPADDGDRAMFRGTGPFHPDLLPFPFPPSPIDGGGWANAFLRTRSTGSTDLLTRDVQGRALRGSAGLWDVHFPRSEVLFGFSGNLLTGPDLDPTRGPQLWIRNWQTGDLELLTATLTGALSEGGGESATFSRSGRFVVFAFGGNDLGPSARLGDYNVYLRDRELGTTTRLTYPWQGGEFTQALNSGLPPKVSGDGRFVSFESANPELHPDAAALGGTLVYVLDRQSGVLELISRNAEVTGYTAFNSPSDMSDDGRYVAWMSRTFSFSGPPEPTADQRAIWVLDRNTGQRVNVTASLGPLYRDSAISMDLSADGSVIAFTWRSSDINQPLLFDRPLVYTAQLRTETPYEAPLPVPVGQPSTLWLCILLILFGTVLSRRRYRR